MNIKSVRNGEHIWSTIDIYPLQFPCFSLHITINKCLLFCSIYGRLSGITNRWMSLLFRLYRWLFADSMTHIYRLFPLIITLSFTGSSIWLNIAWKWMKSLHGTTARRDGMDRWGCDGSYGEAGATDKSWTSSHICIMYYGQLPLFLVQRFNGREDIKMMLLFPTEREIILFCWI